MTLLNTKTCICVEAQPVIEGIELEEHAIKEFLTLEGSKPTTKKNINVTL